MSPTRAGRLKLTIFFLQRMNGTMETPTQEFLLRVINAWEGRVEQLIGRRGFFTFREELL